MRKILLLMVASVAILSSCSHQKHEDPAPLATAGADSVTITGTTYAVVKIGQQKWTAVNYNGPGGIYNTGTGQLSVANGKLYTSLEGAKIALPEGWRIPTYKDYLNLLIARGATKDTDGNYIAGLPVALSLMSTSGWSEPGANNYSNFNALPTGFYHLQTYYGSGNGTAFLHALTVGGPPDLGFMIGPGPVGEPMIFLGIYLDDADACSIRFVKDN